MMSVGIAEALIIDIKALIRELLLALSKPIKA